MAGYSLSGLTTWTEEQATPFLSSAVMKAKTIPYLRHWAGLKGAVKLPKLETAYDNWQSGVGCVNTASGTTTISQKTLTPKALKIFDRFCQQDLEAYFTRQDLPAGGQYEGLNPYEQAILTVMGERFAKTLEMVAWQGNTNASQTFASLNLLDGFNTQITADLGSIPTAQKLTGSVAEADIVTSVEAMVAALPADQFDNISQDSEYVLFMGSDVRRTYFKKYRSLFTALPYNMDFNKVYVDGTSIEIVGVGGLYGTDNMVLHRRSDMWVGYDLESELGGGFRVQQGVGSEMDYSFVSAKFHLGFAINFIEKAVVNGYE